MLLSFQADLTGFYDPVLSLLHILFSFKLKSFPSVHQLIVRYLSLLEITPKLIFRACLKSGTGDNDILSIH